MFRGVLERADFGVLDNFFDLSGHSLLAARFMARLRMHRALTFRYAIYSRALRSLEWPRPSMHCRGQRSRGRRQTAPAIERRSSCKRGSLSCGVAPSGHPGLDRPPRPPRGIRCASCSPRSGEPRWQGWLRYTPILAIGGAAHGGIFRTGRLRDHVRDMPSPRLHSRVHVSLEPVRM